MCERGRERHSDRVCERERAMIVEDDVAAESSVCVREKVSESVRV